MVVILMGVSGCGKSTVGRELAGVLGWRFYDADGFHPPANIEKMSRKEPLTDEDRRPWLAALRARIGACLESGENAVLACSALSEWSRGELGVERPGVRLVYLKGSFDLIRHRLEARTDHFMPPDLLRSQFDALREPRGAMVVDIAPAPQEIAAGIARALKTEGTPDEEG